MLSIVVSLLLALLMFGGAWVGYQDPSLEISPTQALGLGASALAFCVFQIWARSRER